MRAREARPRGRGLHRAPRGERTPKWLRTERLYGRLPVAAQNAVVAWHGARTRRDRFGPGYEPLSRLLEQSERWTRDELRAYQESRLSVVVRHAYDTVPYYRDLFDRLGLRPADIRSSGDLARLPVLTREDVRANAPRLVSRAVPAKSLHSANTSGTSGTPVTVRWDRAVRLMNNACYMRLRRWAGAPLGTRYGTITGRPIVPLAQDRPPFWRHNPRWNQIMFSSLHLSERNLEHYTRAIRGHRIKALEAYPTSAYIIARHLEARGEQLPLKCLITTGEPLLPDERALIEERFRVRIFDAYGEAERVVFSAECEVHDGHHLYEEYGITEVVDERGVPLPPGERGRIAGTSLHNLGMPLIRYTFGDVGALADRSCPCGRALMLLDGLTSRDEDIIVAPDGRLIPPVMVSWAPRLVEGVTNWQLVQEKRDEIVARFVVARPLTDADRRQLTTYFGRRFGPLMRVAIEEVSEIPLSGRGKHRRVVSKVPLPWGEQARGRG